MFKLMSKCSHEQLSSAFIFTSMNRFQLCEFIRVTTLNTHQHLNKRGNWKLGYRINSVIDYLLTCMWLELSERHCILLAASQWTQYPGLMMFLHSAGITSLWFDSVSVFLSNQHPQGEGSRGWCISVIHGTLETTEDFVIVERSSWRAGIRWCKGWLLRVCLDRLLMVQGSDNQLTTGGVAGSSSKISVTDWIQTSINWEEGQQSQKKMVSFDGLLWKVLQLFYISYKKQCSWIMIDFGKMDLRVLHKMTLNCLDSW